MDRPPVGLTDFCQARHVIFDGTYLEAKYGIFVALDGTSNNVLDGAYGIKEGTEAMLKFLLSMKNRGL